MGYINLVHRGEGGIMVVNNINIETGITARMIPSNCTRDEGMNLICTHQLAVCTFGTQGTDCYGFLKLKKGLDQIPKELLMVPAEL